MVAKLVATVITTLLVLLITGAMGEGREGAVVAGSARPHGLPFERPIALTPSAYDFFHPGVVPTRARSAAPSPAPARAAAAAAGLRGALDAGRARADAAVGGAWLAPPRSRRGGEGDAGPGARGVAGAAVGAAAAAALALACAGASFVVVRRRANIRRAKGDDARAYVA